MGHQPEGPQFESEPRYLKAPERVPFLFQALLFRTRTKDLAVMRLVLDL